MRSKQDHLYWKGIAKAQKARPAHHGNAKKSLDFLDDALEFVRKLKKKPTESPPTEIELYKRWKRLKIS